MFVFPILSANARGGEGEFTGGVAHGEFSEPLGGIVPADEVLHLREEGPVGGAVTFGGEVMGGSAEMESSGVSVV